MFSAKKRHFKKRLANIQSAIYDLEFNRAKLKAIKEQMRLQYDRLQETTSSAQAGLESENSKEQPDKSVISNLERVIERYKPDIEYLSKQLEGMDNAIDCATLDDKGNPIGINQRIEAARTMKEMLVDYIKTL